MPTRKLKVTVLMPVYNAERFLRRSIDSIIVQSFSDFEFIIVNDGSTDASEDIMESYRDPRLRRFHNKKNEGPVSALNTGLRYARGEYIAVMHADDISLPRRLEKQVAYMDSHPEIGVVATHVMCIDEDDRVTHIKCYPESPNLLRWRMFYQCPVVHPSTMMRYEVLKKVGFYNRDFELVEDYDLWSRMLGITKISTIPEYLLKYRMWEGALTSTHAEEVKRQDARIKSFLLAEELGRRIKMETVRNLQKISFVSVFSTISQIEELIDLNYELYVKFMQSYTLNSQEKIEIKKDISRKLYLLAFKALRISITDGFPVLIRILRISPVIFPSLFIVEALKRLFRFKDTKNLW